jgi:hypothetical protein
MPKLHALLPDSTATRLKAVTLARAFTCSNDRDSRALDSRAGELNLETSPQLEQATLASSSSNWTRVNAGVNAPTSFRNRASPCHGAVDARAGERALTTGAISAAIVELRAISKATVPRRPARA